MNADATPGREAVLRDQSRLFRRLLTHVWNSSPFYREFYSAHGIRQDQLAELTVADLPFLTKATVMEHFDRVATDPRVRKAQLERWLDRVRDPSQLYQDDLIVLHGSGSSGTFGLFAYGRTDWNVMSAAMAGRLPPPPHEGARPRLAYVCINRGHYGGVSTAVQLRATYDVAIVPALDSHERIIEQLEGFQPDRLTGHSSGIARLAEAALEGKLRIRPRQVLTVGDLLRPAMEAKIRQAWGAPVLNHYGAVESMFLGVRGDGDTSMALMDDLNAFEVLDQSDRPVPVGGSGRVVITNLYNYTLPLLRYEMGDQVVRGDVLPSGHGSIRSILPGSEQDALPLAVGGRRVNLSPTALRTFFAAGVEGVQFIARDGGAEVAYVAQRELEREVRTEFDRLLAAFGASGAEVAVRRVPFIAPDPRTAKVRLVVLDAAPASAAPAMATVAGAARASTPFEKHEIDGSLAARFERMVERYGGRPAFQDRDRTVTYAELDRAANRVARTLLARGDSPEPVALLVKPGLAAVTAIFGILKAGKFYLPLDRAAPELRLASILHDTEARTILTDTAHLPAATALAAGNREVVNLDALPQGLPDDAPRLAVTGDACSYLLYTSGSTGRPKGVLHNHRSILHQIAAYAAVLSPGPDDRVSFLHSHCFSASRLDIFGALLNGACLVHFDIASEGLGRVAEWLREQEITLLQWLPTAFRHFAGGLDGSEEFSSLRWVMLGSEPLLARDVAMFRRHFAGGCRLLNRYATTETGTIAYQEVDEATEAQRGTAPVGQPIDGVDVVILGESGAALGPGEIGEIAVSSPSLAVGYWRRPELTRQAFQADPATGRTAYRTGDLGYRLPDGALVHAGRKDFQRKVLGYRVEVEETEALLLAHPGVREAAVATVDEAGGGRLVAYIVAQGRVRPSGTALRSHLRSRLPAYMVPAAFIWLEALPLNANGKLDRLSLVATHGTDADADVKGGEPRTPAEEQLSVIWRDVLGRERIGVEDNFFDVGGDSLRAGQVRARIAAAFGLLLDIREFFESPTIAALAKLIEG